MRIYPETEIEYSGMLGVHVVTTMTTLRKKHTDGLYYLILFKHSYADKTDKVIDKPYMTKHSLDALNKMVYKFLINGEIVPGQELSGTGKMFVIDKDQREESDRLLTHV